MAGLTIPIPLDRLAPGEHTYGPASVDDDVVHGTLTIDRTVSQGPTQGLNAQPATTTVEIGIWQSDDAGASWQLRASSGQAGGNDALDEAGVPMTYSDVSVDLSPGTSRRVKALVTVGGDRVAVAGSLVVT